MKTETRLWIVVAIIGVALLLYLLGPILTPFLISALLAWLGDPVADRLEAWRFPRALAVAVVFLGTFVIIALLVLLIAPMVGREVTELSARGPQFFTWYEQVVTPWLSSHLHIEPARLRIVGTAPRLDNVVVERDQGSDKGLPVAQHHRLGDAGMISQQGFHCSGCHVLST